MSLLTPTLPPAAPHASSGRNILVLTADIGCGHGRAAAALTLQLRTHHPHHQTTILDALTLCPRWFTFAYRDLYLLGCKHLPKLSGRIYDLTDFAKPTERSLSHKIESFALSRLVNLPALRQADLVLTTHFLTARVLSHLKSIGRLSARLAVVVTDQHPHAVWRVPHADLFCVASPPAADTLRASGIPASRIRITGIPIDERFHNPLPKHLARQRHNLPQDRPIVLLSGGGLGLGGIDTALHALLSAPPPDNHLPPQHPVVVCGKNTKLFQKLTAQYPPDSTSSLRRSVASSLSLPPTLLGHTSRMHELMAAADLLLGKPGGLTTSEAAASHLPMVLLKPLPGQEQHNARALTAAGLAELHENPHTAGQAAAALAHNPQKLAQMRAATHHFSPPHPTSHAINAALDLLTSTPR
jgi:processive 1,2-diacylglycerol beta-glucosyltransferase